MRKTYGSLRFAKHLDKWIVEDVPPHISIKIKDIFKNMGMQVRPPYIMKATRETEADLAWFMRRYPLLISQEDLDLLEQGERAHYDFHQNVFELYQDDYEPQDLQLKPGFELKPFQGQGRDIFWAVKELLLADVMGLGKTIQAIAALTKKEFRPAVVVVQAHLPKQWKDEIEEWSDLKVCNIKGGTPKQLPRADVYLIKYTILHKWIDYLIHAKPKTLVFDEIQEVRHPDTKKHEAAKKLHQATDYHLGLSGTPIYNYGNEVWNIFQVIKPGLFPDEQEFKRAWCDGNVIRDPKALGSYLRESKAYLRRTKEDVGSQIPPVNRITHAVEYDDQEMMKMEYNARILARTLLEKGSSFVQKGQAARELSIMVRKATGVAKARGVAAFVRILLESGEPVLLTGWHRDVYDIWLKELSGFRIVMYTGSETEREKEEAKRKFISGEADLFILSNRSGAGLDGLQERCNYVVIGELDWSPQVHNQIIGRLDRMGQTKQVTAIFLVTDSGSDPIVMDICGLKKSQQDGIFDPFSSGDKQEADDSIIKAFAKKFLEARDERVELP